MPLFMFISGYTVFVAKGYSRKPALFLKHRLTQLILPFLTWSFLLAVKHSSPQYLLMVFVQPDYGLWFLLVLFYIATIHYLIYYKYKDNRIILPIIVLLYSLLRVISTLTDDMFGTRLLATHLVYYSLGYTISQIINKCSPRLLRVLMIICLLTYISIFVQFHWGYPIISTPLVPKIVNDLLDTFIKMMMSLSACLFILLLFKEMSQSLNNDVIKVIGKETLGIYVIHFCILSFMKELQLGYNLIAALIIVVGLLIVSHLIIYLIKKSFLLPFFMLGIQKS